MKKIILFSLFVAFFVVSVAHALTPTNPGDLNSDGNVNMQDVLLIVNCLNQNAPTCQNAQADPNNDGLINLFDFVTIGKNWGRTYLTSSLPNGLIASYSFTADASDSSGSNLNGVLMNGAAITSGRYGNGVQLDGINDYVDIGNPAALNDKRPITITAWINPTTEGYIIGKRFGTCTGYWRLDIAPSGNLTWLGLGTNTITSAAVPYGSWTHIALTWNGVTSTYYINGQLASATTAGTATLSSDSTCKLVFGTRDGTQSMLAGTLDEVRIYDRILTLAEIQTDMNTQGDGQQNTQFCGNSVVEGTEQCDLGAGNGACPNVCSTGCTTNTCVPAVSATINASPITITVGSSSTLTWSSTNANSCTASGGWSGTKTTTGAQSVFPTSTTTYSLVCSGSGGASSQSSVTVVVNSAGNQFYSTYLAGNSEDIARDIYLDSVGNIYISGGTKSTNFYTTPGAYDRTHNGNMDMFVMKFTPNGSLVFSTLVGGTGYDRAYGLEVDNQGYIYLGGRGGANFPTTPGVVQTVFGGDLNPNVAYGTQDGAIAKLTPDGSQLVWATYIGSNDGGFFRDIDIDSASNVYAIMAQVENPVLTITPGAFQATFGGAEDMYIVKLSSNAQQILASTYVGGSDIDGWGPAIRALDSGEVYFSSGVFSPDMPVSANAYDRTHNGNQDFYVGKLSADFSQLLGGTYIGGSSLEFSETHSVWVEPSGTILIGSGSASSDFPTTTGAYDTSYNGGVTDAYIARLSGDLSSLLVSTYIGGSGTERIECFNVDAQGNIFMGGTTTSTNFPTSSNGNDRTFGGGTSDGWIGRLSSDLSTLVYSSYIGGSGLDEARCNIGTTSAIYSVGQTDSSNFVTSSNGLMQTIGTGKDGYFTIIPLS